MRTNALATSPIMSLLLFVLNTDACETDWKKFDCHCYYFAHTASVSFSDAQTECQNNGSKLVSIHSQEEQDFVGGM